MKAYTPKQAEVKTVQVGDNTFYLQPFSAFKTVHLTGELSALVGPVLSALAPFMSSEKPLDSSVPLRKQTPYFVFVNGLFGCIFIRDSKK